jgi:hypothetical protein
LLRVKLVSCFVRVGHVRHVPHLTHARCRQHASASHTGRACSRAEHDNTETFSFRAST